MSRRSPPLTPIWLCFITASIAGSCSSPDTEHTPESPPLTVVDATGREISLAKPARRVVSLVPSATNTLYAMGAEDVLVGRTDFDRGERATALPSIGGGIEPNLEAIVALRPDLVIRFAGDQDSRTPARLDQLGVPHLAVRPDRVEDIYRTTIILGQATGYSKEAAALVESIRADLTLTAESVAELPRRRVAYVLGGTPPWVAGPETYIHEVISLMGGDNVFADLGALYAAVSPEELLTRDIEVVLVSGDGYDAAWTPGARIEIIGGVLEMPGPGVVDAARIVARLLHGTDVR
jgi:ABC-type Fe3+-hydroxamate transport system substrate-binding protein